MDGQTLRDRFDLRLQVSANDDCLGDRGSRYVGVKSCKPMIEEAAAALDRERTLRKEADEALELAWEELNRATEDLDCEHARREAAISAAFDAAVSACVGASYGPPSGWGDGRPRGWHLTEPCSPRDACMHDNGCMDAARRIRLRQNADAERRESHV